MFVKGPWATIRSAALRAIAALCLLVALTLGNASAGSIASAQTAELAVAPGSEVVRARCVTCHGADIISSQRLSKPGWEREVDKMIGWGAEVGSAERDKIIEYLSEQFGVSGPPPTEAEQRAAELLMPRCLVCHDASLIERQRLTSAGWTRELDKMIGWGAVLTEAERDLLSRYLARKFGLPR